MKQVSPCGSRVCVGMEGTWRRYMSLPQLLKQQCFIISQDLLLKTPRTLKNEHLEFIPTRVLLYYSNKFYNSAVASMDHNDQTSCFSVLFSFCFCFLFLLLFVLQDVSKDKPSKPSSPKLHQRALL